MIPEGLGCLSPFFTLLVASILPCTASRSKFPALTCAGEKGAHGKGIKEARGAKTAAGKAFRLIFIFRRGHWPLWRPHQKCWSTYSAFSRFWRWVFSCRCWWVDHWTFFLIFWKYLSAAFYMGYFIRPPQTYCIHFMDEGTNAKDGASVQKSNGGPQAGKSYFKFKNCLDLLAMYFNWENHEN